MVVKLDYGVVSLMYDNGDECLPLFSLVYWSL